MVDSADRDTGTDAADNDKPPHYERLREISATNFSIAYLAHDHVLNRDVFIKQLRNTYDPTDAKRFLQEGRFLARIGQHPHIVQVYAAEVIDGLPSIIMEYAPNGSLASRRHDYGGDWSAVITLVDQVLDGLVHIHKQGIIHRDVKPLNILIGAHGEAKIADFNISVLREAEERLTALDKRLGTDMYASPEYVDASDEGTRVDPRNDVYSAALIAAELLNGGRHPFRSTTGTPTGNKFEWAGSRYCQRISPRRSAACSRQSSRGTRPSATRTRARLQPHSASPSRPAATAAFSIVSAGQRLNVK